MFDKIENGNYDFIEKFLEIIKNKKKKKMMIKDYFDYQKKMNC